MTLFLWLSPDPAADARAAAHRLFAQGLRTLYGIERPPVRALGERGKPYLPEHPEICFNLSHCRGGAVCGFDSLPIGVDLQDLRPLREGLTRRVLSPAEAGLLAQTPGDAARQRLFARFWSRKEAELKRLGSGIGSLQALAALDTLALPGVASFDYPHAVLSVAGRDAEGARIVLVEGLGAPGGALRTLRGAQ